MSSVSPLVRPAIPNTWSSFFTLSEKSCISFHFSQLLLLVAEGLSLWDLLLRMRLQKGNTGRRQDASLLLICFSIISPGDWHLLIIYTRQRKVDQTTRNHLSVSLRIRVCVCVPTKSELLSDLHTDLMFVKELILKFASGLFLIWWAPSWRADESVLGLPGVWTKHKQLSAIVLHMTNKLPGNFLLHFLMLPCVSFLPAPLYYTALLDPKALLLWRSAGCASLSRWLLCGLISCLTLIDLGSQPTSVARHCYSSGLFVFHCVRFFQAPRYWTLSTLAEAHYVLCILY